jgi:hypothetical protein
VAVEGTPLPPDEAAAWRWRAQPVHAEYIGLFLELARAHRVPVFWVIPPATSGWSERNRLNETSAAYRRFVESWLDRFAGLTVLSALDLEFGDGLFRDPVHLNRDGAVRLSIAVADSLAIRLEDSSREPRWIELRRPDESTPRPWQHLLEDLEESRLATGRLDVSGNLREVSR